MENQEKLHGIYYDDFKLKFDACSIKEYPKVINDINKKSFKINSLRCSINNINIKNILDSSLYEDSLLDTNNNMNQYKILSSVQHDITGDSLYKRLNDLKIPYKKYIIDENEIFKLMDISLT